ncbi:starch synthase [Ensifer adhaerens]|nr:starch synthase [Ensifer adhaerens]
MKVLSVASEIYPLIKTGGLADVAGALPLAMGHHGVEMRSLIPGYPAVMTKVGKTKKVATIPSLFGVKANILFATHEGLELYILDAPDFFKREGGPYTDALGKDHPDNWKRFAALSLAAAEIAAGLISAWKPDLVHAHDWQAGLVPVYMRYGRAPETPSVITVHNIAFQGQFSSAIFPELALPPEAYSVDGIEYYGDVGYLKGGLQMAHAITTVSPTYAREIHQGEFGMGLEGLIRARASHVSGIVNGIDTAVWNPLADPMLAAPFSAKQLTKRAANREAVMRHFGLDGDGPIFCVISRLTWQKGMDLLTEVAGDIVAQGGMLAILGSGDRALEGGLLQASYYHRGRIGVHVGYDEPLSHVMQAGCDAILIPSRFEPCGLTQLYALRYGCVPVVARTGGLADTVIDANEAALSAGVATGFQFSNISADGLRQTLGRVFEVWHQPDTWRQLQKNGMKSDVSWDKSAAAYAALYAQLISKGH